MTARLALGAVLLLGCHHGAGRPDPAPCAEAVESSGAPVPADSLAGEYRLQLTSDSGPAAAVEGTLRLRAADPGLHPRTGPYGIPDTTHRYPLVGSVEINLAAVGAVAPGGTTSSDPAAPGVLVIERVGGQPSAERVLLRLGAEANHADQVRFDGGYTVLRVRQIDRGSFQGDWESGAPLPQAHGHFCASRTKAPT
jgi:hypothetical protein